jgi:hypothetical protein
MAHQSLREIELIAVGQPSLLKALHKVTGCASCSQSASICFESVLGEALCNSSAEYILGAIAECPRCASPISENTLVSVNEMGSNQPSLETEAADVVFIDEATLLEAQSFVTGCENCNSEASGSTFDQVLDAITGCDPTVTEYVICHAAKCPRCFHDVMEKTLVVTY